MTTSYRPTGLIRYHAAGTYRGYTLFSPNGGDDAYLIDMEGYFVHRWHYPGGIAYGFLLDNGNLLFRDRGYNPPGADHIRELDWDSRLVWEYYNPSLRRHDRLPNGNNLLLLQRDRIPAELTRRVRGGFTTASDPEQMLSDQVVEVTSAGVEVDVWRSADHLVPETDMICPLERRDAWGGANDLTSSPDGSTFLISFRILDTVALVDRSTSEITWKWGPGNISHQHHPTYLDNGHVLLLDNGAHRRGLSYSRVIEVEPVHQRDRVAVPGPADGVLFHPLHRRGATLAQRQHSDNRRSYRQVVRGNPRKRGSVGIRQSLRRSVPVRHGQRRVPSPSLRPRSSGLTGKRVGPGAIR